jgi:predicted DNA-binding protein
MLPERKLVSFRMSIRILALIDALSAQLGMNKTSVIAEAIRILAKREKVKV